MQKNETISLKDVKPILDACGEIRELAYSSNVSLAYVTLNGVAKKHKHHVMEELYFITKGSGYVTIGDEKYLIKEGDSINISKEKYHFLEGNLEALVITSPKFIPEDLILYDKE